MPSYSAENARAAEIAIGSLVFVRRIHAARTFIQRHEGENSVFGRLAADLSVLVEIVDDSDSVEFVDVARTALTYFAETAGQLIPITRSWRPHSPIGLKSRSLPTHGRGFKLSGRSIFP